MYIAINRDTLQQFKVNVLPTKLLMHYYRKQTFINIRYQVTVQEHVASLFQEQQKI